MLGQAFLVRSDVRGTLPLADGSIHCVVTSPPYFGLRDYKDPRQVGLEASPEEYVGRMVTVFREVHRVLRDDGTLWLNLGDSYANDGKWGGHTGGKHARALHCSPIGRNKRYTGLKPKDLIGIPWRVAFALQDDGWYLRSDIIWHKPNPMPESVRDRPTKGHEYLFLLGKGPAYFYDQDADREPHEMRPQRRPGGRPADETPRPGQPRQAWSTAVREEVGIDGHPDGRNLRTVWTIGTAPYPGAHFATMPPALAGRCIKLGTPERGCCPACGAPCGRVVARERTPSRPGSGSKVLGLEASVVGNRDPRRHVTASRTLGWESSCSCNAGPPVPCRVLDPFSGSGTTPAVARELGRVGIGLEVNAKYLALAAARVRRPAIARDNPSLATPRGLAPLEGQLEMFG